MFTDDLAVSTVMTVLSGPINVMVRLRCVLFFSGLLVMEANRFHLIFHLFTHFLSRLILHPGHGSSDFD